MKRAIKSCLSLVGAALLCVISPAAWADDTVQAAYSCVPDGSVDDTLGQWACCSGYAVSGSTVCTNPSDYASSWQSCRHVCGTAPVNGCIPSGGWDDTLSKTYCCSGQAVPGSTWCLNPADYNNGWKSCVQQCK